MRSLNRKGNVSPAAITVIVLLLLIIAGGVYMLFFKGPSSTANVPGEELTEEQIDSLVGRVGQLMMLPEEEPLVATVEDFEQLRAEQAFYKDVQNGDKLLIFPQAAKAVIYNEAKNMIVNAGPIFVNDEAGAAAGVPAGTTQDPVQ